MFQCSKLPCLGWTSADFLQGFFANNVCKSSSNMRVRVLRFLWFLSVRFMKLCRQISENRDSCMRTMQRLVTLVSTNRRVPIESVPPLFAAKKSYKGKSDTQKTVEIPSGPNGAISRAFKSGLPDIS
jgi:hypothetical protein